MAALLTLAGCGINERNGMNSEEQELAATIARDYANTDEPYATSVVFLTVRGDKITGWFLSDPAQLPQVTPYGSMVIDTRHSLRSAEATGVKSMSIRNLLTGHIYDTFELPELLIPGDVVQLSSDTSILIPAGWGGDHVRPGAHLDSSETAPVPLEYIAISRGFEGERIERLWFERYGTRAQMMRARLDNGPWSFAPSGLPGTPLVLRSSKRGDVLARVRRHGRSEAEGGEWVDLEVLLPNGDGEQLRVVGTMVVGGGVGTDEEIAKEALRTFMPDLRLETAD
jgi:hypothetical protein